MWRSGADLLKLVNDNILGTVPLSLDESRPPTQWVARGMASTATVPVGDAVVAQHASRRAVALAVRRAGRRPCVAARARGARGGENIGTWRCGASPCLTLASRDSGPRRRIVRAAGVETRGWDLNDGYDDSQGSDKAISDTTSPPPGSSTTRPLPPLLQMPTSAAALKVGSPVVAVGLLRSAFHLTDAFWAGALGPEHLSALMYNAFAVWLIALACAVMATGVQAFVSKRVGGGGDARAVADVVADGMWGALFTYLVLLLLAPLIPSVYARGLGLDTTTAAYALGKEHLAALLLGSAGLVFGNVLEAAFRGLGKTKESLNVVCVSVLVAAVLDPALMFGCGPFPKCGIAGAAIGSSIAALVNAALHLWVLRKQCGVEMRFAKPNFANIKKMAAVGLPLASSGVVFTLVTIALGRVASMCGPHHLAALALGQKFEAIAFTVCEGFRLACATLVGQWQGAGDAKAARDAASAIVKTCVLSVVPFTVLFFVMGSGFEFFGWWNPGGVIRLIAGGPNADQAVVDAAATYLRWNSGALLFLAAEAVAEGAFTGAGNTLPVLCIGAVCNLLRVPLAHYLAFSVGWGIQGLWVTIVVTQIVKAVLKWWWFREVESKKRIR